MQYRPKMYLDIQSLPVLSFDLPADGLYHNSNIPICASGFLDTLQSALQIPFQVDFCKLIRKYGKTVLVFGSASAPAWFLTLDVVGATVA